jgi:hypothetical protein
MRTILLIALLALTSHARAAAPPAEPSTPLPLTGKVAETMDAGGYTYLLVQQADRQTWVATTPIALKVGDQVRINDGWTMKDFQSRALKRKFDWILFAQRVEVNGQPAAGAGQALPPGHPPIPGATATTPALPPGHPVVSNTTAAATTLPPATAPIEVKPGTVEKLPGGCTVADCYTKKKELTGQTIQLRGVVVKFSAAIMGKNWAHLRDGTGQEGTDDLTVTTAATLKPGDIVAVKGRLVGDQDFGAGYKYSVLLEDAVVIEPQQK